jgi:L-asparaginase II
LRWIQVSALIQFLTKRHHQILLAAASEAELQMPLFPLLACGITDPSNPLLTLLARGITDPPWLHDDCSVGLSWMACSLQHQVRWTPREGGVAPQSAILLLVNQFMQETTHARKTCCSIVA